MKLKSENVENVQFSTQLKRLLFKRIHILQWIRNYTQLDAVSDIIAGITVGLTMIPQSMAYASLADLPPHYGLYSAFMGSFIYVIFGTIKEVSIGPTSLMALCAVSYTEHLPVDFMVLLCFLCGWVELLMGMLKLGFIVDFISAPAISGFTSATAAIIIINQLKALCGIKFIHHGMIDYVHQFYDRLPDTRTGDLILGVCCTVFLIAFRYINRIPVKNEVGKKILWLFSIGRNAFTVLVSSCLARYYEISTGEIPFTISGNVPKGIPDFRLPNFSTTINNQTIPFTEMVSTLGSGMIVLPVVAVLANVAIAKAFAVGKVVDATQEMLTLGLCNIFGSFVQSMPTCGAFTRSAVANASGIRTPLGGLYSGALILLALTFLTPYFYYVPAATLAAVLISAVMFMIDFEILPKLWKSSKFDLIVTVFTFSASLSYGVESGLFVGVVVSLIPLLKRWSRPRVTSELCATNRGYEFIHVKPDLGLMFPAVDYLTQYILQRTAEESNKTLPVVIDFDHILQIDYSAIQSLSNLIKTHKEHGQEIVLFRASPSIFASLKTLVNTDELNFCDTEEELNYKIEEWMFPAHHDEERPLLKTNANPVYYNNEKKAPVYQPTTTSTAP